MKKSLLPLAVLVSATAAAPQARADVAWNHLGSIKIGKSPVLTFSLQNQWSGADHRVSFNVDASKIAPLMGVPTGQSARGGFQIIERLDADRLIVSSPQSRNFIDEPYKSLKNRLRLNFWEALGSNLSPDNIPELSPAQRERLGQEIRALVSPLTKKFSRTYFRALPNTRVINGLSSRGYRYTSMVNASGDKKRPLWVRANAEWWLAEGLAGDEDIRAFTQNANGLKSGPKTASMWANEYLPIAWEAAPEEAHQALASMIGAPTSQNYGFRGTPVQFFVTISAPPAAGMAMGGDLKLALELKDRNTTSVSPALFEAPAGATRIEIEPFLGVARNFIKMSRGQIEQLMK